MPETCNEKRCCTLSQRNRPGFLCRLGKDGGLCGTRHMFVGNFLLRQSSFFAGIYKKSALALSMSKFKKKGERDREERVESDRSK